MKSVILGQVDLGSPVRLPGLQVDIAKVVSHPKFTLDPVSINDIAMVKLIRPVSFTDMIRPICIFQVYVPRNQGHTYIIGGKSVTKQELLFRKKRRMSTF